MALRWGDRVAETTTTTGTGPLTLAGAITGYQRFSAIPSITTNDTVYYAAYAVDGSGVPTGDWETGLGTYSAANTLTRTTVQESSNSNSAVSFSAGTKYVIACPTATLLAALVQTGAITTSGLTQSTAKLLGRTTASTGAIEEISASTGLTFSGGALSVTQPAALTLITETVTTSTAANVSFTSIPATYRDLEVRVRGRGTKSAADVDIRIRFNNDSTAIYDNIDPQFHYNGSVMVNGGNNFIAETSGLLGFIAAATAPSNVADISIANIGDYHGTTFQKAFTARNTTKDAASSTNIYAILLSGWWRSTAAITQIDVFPSSAAFVDGTVVSLYGQM